VGKELFGLPADILTFVVAVRKGKKLFRMKPYYLDGALTRESSSRETAHLNQREYELTKHVSRLQTSLSLSYCYAPELRLLKLALMWARPPIGRGRSSLATRDRLVQQIRAWLIRPARVRLRIVVGN